MFILFLYYGSCCLDSTRRLLVSVGLGTEATLYRFCDPLLSHESSTQYNLIELLTVAISFLLYSLVHTFVSVVACYFI